MGVAFTSENSFISLYCGILKVIKMFFVFRGFGFVRFSESKCVDKVTNIAAHMIDGKKVRVVFRWDLSIKTILFLVYR